VTLVFCGKATLGESHEVLPTGPQLCACALGSSVSDDDPPPPPPFVQVQFTVNWRPFQLDASSPKQVRTAVPRARRVHGSGSPPLAARSLRGAERGAGAQGVNKMELYYSKFGEDRVNQMMPRMTQVFSNVGLKYSMGGLTGNTFDSHRLATWALAKGGPAAQDKLMEEMFINYFTEEKFLGDKQVSPRCPCRRAPRTPRRAARAAARRAPRAPRAAAADARVHGAGTSGHGGEGGSQPSGGRGRARLRRLRQGGRSPGPLGLLLCKVVDEPQRPMDPEL
jgi:hypothetical protein